MLTEVVFDWLNTALDCGIVESDFWNMTMAELRRAVASRNRIEKERLKEKATFDYILADLVGKSVSRIYSSSAKMPEIEATYPSIFDSQKLAEEKQAKADTLSALRFKQFANSFNTKFKEVQSVK